MDELAPGALAERIAARLGLAPRFRQIVVPAPIGEPLWADDPTFSLDRHIEVASDSPRGQAGIERLAGDFLSRPLDRRRPLWELLVVPRAGPGKAAVLGKVHHAMVDGLAAVELGTLLFDLAPNAAAPEVGDWVPEPPGSGVRLAVDAATDTALEQFRSARRLSALGVRPRRALRIAETVRRAALAVAEDVIYPAPPSHLNTGIGPRRRLVCARISLARLERIKREANVKLNDVVLAAASGALRRFGAGRESQPRPLRAMVPVSVRDPSDPSGQGNRITFAFVDLPLDEPDPDQRLALIHRQTQELKRSGRVAGTDALLRSLIHMPGFVKERAARLAASPRMYNVAISNVPGPRMPLYAAGARVEAIYPVIPISDGHAIAIGVLTYREHLHFAAYVAADALPNAGELAALFRDAVRELEGSRAAGRARREPGRRDERGFTHPIGGQIAVRD